MFNFKMPIESDVEWVDVDLRFSKISTRVPLKFGSEILDSVTCARARVGVRKLNGEYGVGWGETPLSVQWVWPSDTPYSERHKAMLQFSEILARNFNEKLQCGHALEIGQKFVFDYVPSELTRFNQEYRMGEEPMPWLAALVCASAFDLALHDAYGVVNHVPVYESYCFPYLNYDLDEFLEPAVGSGASFSGKVPSDYLVKKPPNKIPVWHLVGGLDPLCSEDLKGDEPDDGYPVHLEEWIREDGLNCLKIKLRGNDSEWDFSRLVSVGKIAEMMNVEYLTTDFNCMVNHPQYVNQILDKLKVKFRSIWERILYVEQPFPYDLQQNRINVKSLSERKPLFMDESAHDWKHVRLGLELGWTGVALKTCKTQTGALLSLCWAKEHKMDLMVQDLTNPMLAQIPHVLLGAHAGTIMGVESNAMQFYPDASSAEAIIHPGLYRRRNGTLDISTLKGSGFGYGMNLN